MKKTAFYTDEQTFWHTAGNYSLIFPVGEWVEPPSNGSSCGAESPESKRRFKNLLVKSGITNALKMQSAMPLSRKELSLVHDLDYIDAIRAASQKGGGILDLKYGHDTPVGNGTYEIAALSAGLTVQAVEDIYLGRYKNAYSLSRPPGHHATRNKAMGYCYFNNIALAIEQVKNWHNLGKVAIVDWDVHHGNGQQEIYYDRNDVLTISIHQQNCYPTYEDFQSGTSDSEVEARGKGPGLGYNMNIPLFPGVGHDSYLYAMDSIVLPALRKFQPEIIIVACGFDANIIDPLARMQLHSDSYRELTRKILQIADEICDGKVVFTHEGGYAESYVPFCGMAVIEELSSIKTPVIDPMLKYFISRQPNSALNAFQKSHIDKWAEIFLTHFL